MKCNYLVLKSFNGYSLRVVKCPILNEKDIGKLQRPGERFVTVIGHYAGRLTAEKAEQLISQRKDWAEYFSKGSPSPFSEEQTNEMVQLAGYRGAAEQLMRHLKLGKRIEGRSREEKEALFDSVVKPALAQLETKEAAIVILGYGLKDAQPWKKMQLSTVFSLTRGRIHIILKTALAKLFWAIQLGGKQP